MTVAPTNLVKELTAYDWKPRRLILFICKNATPVGSRSSCRPLTPVGAIHVSPVAKTYESAVATP